MRSRLFRFWGPPAGSLAVLVWMLLAGPATASSLSVNPVRVDLPNPGAIQTLTVTNRGNEPVVLQATTVDWTIEDNDDRYAETEALVATPPIFTVPAGESQVIRIGLAEKVPSPTQRAYRLFLEETPGQATPAERGQGRLKMNLRIGIPVFLGPTGSPERHIKWHAERTPAGKLRVVAENTGNVHARITKLVLIDNDGRVLREAGRLTYVLPGTRRSWTLPDPPRHAASFRLRIHNQNETTETRLSPE